MSQIELLLSILLILLPFELNLGWRTTPLQQLSGSPKINIETPVDRGILAVWDTIYITDGNYSLQLLESHAEGSQEAVLVGGLRVRNNSAVEIDTPSPTRMPSIPAARITATSPTLGETQGPSLVTPLFTPAMLPTNPVEIRPSQVLEAFGKGAAFTIGCFTLLGACLGLRAMSRRKQ